MKKLNSILIIIFMNHLCLIGQSSVHSAGEFIQAPDYLMTFTLGEIINLYDQGENFTVKNGVIQYDDKITSNTSDIEISELNLYPNPAHDFIRIDRVNTDLKDYKVYDLKGRIVLEGTLANEILSITELAPAAYILKLHSENSLASQLFIKQ